MQFIGKSSHILPKRQPLPIYFWNNLSYTFSKLNPNVSSRTTELPMKPAGNILQFCFSFQICTFLKLFFLNDNYRYPSKIESVEASKEDTLGQHLIEAHWKYFTLEVRDQYECDSAAHLHYEFLLNRCQPKHYLPVLSIFRPSENETQLDTHIYPKPNIPQPGQYNRCWITFLGK